MNVGYIKLAYNYGFLIDCITGKEYFFHKSAIIPPFNIKSFKYGDYVRYQIVVVEGKKKEEAINISLCKPLKEDLLNFNYIPESDYKSMQKSKKAIYRINERINPEELLKNEERILGIVIYFNQINNFGVIKDEKGIDRKFRLNEVKNRIILKHGDNVSLRPSQKETAKNIILLSSTTNSISEAKLNLFRGLKKWQVDARLEPTTWFYESENIDELLNGEKMFVIGRKGTGKTAISQHINNLNSFDTFSEELNFKSFPFSELYEFGNTTLGYQNQHRNLWKYLIYISILRMMSQNERIDNNILSKLREVFPPDLYGINNLSSKLSKYKLNEVKLEILSGMISASFENKAKSFSEMDLSEKNEILETIIITNIDNSKYYILFDDLDEDFSNQQFHYEYFSLLRGLFKSALDTKYLFSDKINIRPIIFLRSDIYNNPGLIDDNKNRWDDFKLDLIWNEFKVKKLLAFRISRVIKPNGEILNYEEISNFLFEKEFVSTNFGEKRIFDFISEQTYLRPRDFIIFFKKLAERAIMLQTENLNVLLRAVSKSYSNSLRTDIASECLSVISAINEILTIVSHIRKNIFYFEDFRVKYEEESVSHNHNLTSIEVLRVLFNYSVIGNITKDNLKIFKYLSPFSEFNEDEPIMIHKGLLSSLQIK